MEHVSVEVISPEMAKQWLEKNLGNNRPIRPKWVSELAKSMLSGKWMFNGNSIVFDNDGNLIDGQHRLSAVVESGMSIRSVVVRGSDEDSFQTIDSGHRRTPSDRLSFQGTPNASLQSAGIRKHLQTIKRGCSIATKENMGADTFAPDHEVVDFYNWHKELCDRIAFFVSSIICKSPLLSGAEIYSLSLFLILLRKHSEEKVFSFFTQVMTGRDVQNDTIFVLRDKLIAHKAKTSIMTVEAKKSAIIKTWNAYITGRPIKVLKFSPDEFKKLRLI